MDWINMTRMQRSLFMSLLVVWASASASPVTHDDVQKAQGSMLDRISKATEAYAAKLKLSGRFVAYCELETELKTHSFPADNFIPFGVNYNEISDSDTLKAVIYSRESFMVSSNMLCLARTKSALRDAERS